MFQEEVHGNQAQPAQPSPQEPKQPQKGDGGQGQDQNSAQGVLNQIKQLGQTNTPQMVQSNMHCLTIVGQIEGHVQLPPKNKTTKYEHLIPQIIAVEQNPKIEGLMLILNTVGGDVEAGLAIAEMVASVSKPTVSLVLGGGHSIGVPIAVSADYSFIAETATMTIHPVRLTGLVIGVPQSFEYMDRMQDRVVRFVTEHSNISKEKFNELMMAKGNLTRDIGTNVVGTDAVKYGLIDEIGGVGKAIAKLNEMIEERRARQNGSQKEQQPQTGGVVQ